MSASRNSLPSSGDFPKDDGSGGSHVERIDTVCHGDANRVVGAINHILCQSVSLSAEDDRQFLRLLQGGVARRDGVRFQCHGGSLEVHSVQVIVCIVNPRPGNQEDRTHGNANGSAVQRVAGGAGQQNGVHAQRRRRAEDGADVGCVRHAVDDCHASCVSAHFLCRENRRTTHRTEHAPREGVAGEFGEQFP